MKPTIEYRFIRPTDHLPISEGDVHEVTDPLLQWVTREEMACLLQEFAGPPRDRHHAEWREKHKDRWKRVRETCWTPDRTRLITIRRLRCVSSG